MFFFFFNDRAPTKISPLPLPDPLPIPRGRSRTRRPPAPGGPSPAASWPRAGLAGRRHRAATRQGSRDRKSTRLNSSHVRISYAVFCLKKKKHKTKIDIAQEIVPRHTLY